MTPGTVLARLMAQHSLRRRHIAAALECSERQVYNYTSRAIPIPALYLARLCDLLDVDSDELVDDDRYLLPDGTSDEGEVRR